MNSWADQVLKMYVSSKPDGIVPTLLLDMYFNHMMESVVFTIKVLGVEVLQITGGCKCLCQPLDVGINESLKSGVQK